MIDRVPHPTRSIAMAFRSILVHLDSGARTSSRVAVAAAPANRHEAQAGLIVVGGYGHSRFRELALGGVTRTLMQTSPVPVFMSH
jgi:hypothetical protein